MAPQGKSMRGGRKTGSSPSVSATIALRESRPIPYVQTPPPDPPSIRKNRPVDLSLKFVPTADTGGFTLTHGDIQAELVNYGYKATDDYYYTVNYLHAWADASLDAQEIFLRDESTGVATTDNGAINRRARVGLHYPKVLQVPRARGYNGNIAILTVSTSDPSSTDMRIGVTIWMKTSNL